MQCWEKLSQRSYGVNHTIHLLTKLDLVCPSKHLQKMHAKVAAIHQWNLCVMLAIIHLHIIQFSERFYFNIVLNLCPACKRDIVTWWHMLCLQRGCANCKENHLWASRLVILFWLFLRLWRFQKHKNIKDIKTMTKQLIMEYALEGQPFLVAVYNRQQQSEIWIGIAHHTIVESQLLGGIVLNECNLDFKLGNGDVTLMWCITFYPHKDKRKME